MTPGASRIFDGTTTVAISLLVISGTRAKRTISLMSAALLSFCSAAVDAPPAAAAEEDDDPDEAVAPLAFAHAMAASKTSLSVARSLSLPRTALASALPSLRKCFDWMAAAPYISIYSN